jgi:hypothetical protein
MINYEAQKNTTMFLLDNTGSIFGTWKGKMSAKNQRELFGHYFGKGTIEIDGETDTITHTIKVDFGRDICDTGSYNLITGDLIINNRTQQNQKQGVC